MFLFMYDTNIAMDKKSLFLLIAAASILFLAVIWADMPGLYKFLVIFAEMAVVSKTQNRERVVELSRQKYGVESSSIEGKINKWVETTFDKGMAIAQENRDNNSQEPKDQPPSEKAQPQLQAHGSFQLKD